MELAGRGQSRFGGMPERLLWNGADDAAEVARLEQQLQSIDGWPGLEGDDLEIIQDNRSFLAKECSDSRCGRSSREVPVGLLIVASLGVNPGSELEPLAVCFHA